jgi:hypothetical protein
MMKIFHVVVGTRNPNGDDRLDKGSAEEGWYKIDNDVLMLCDIGGSALRNSDGAPITARLEAGQVARQVAARLILRRWRSEQGDDRNDFNRRISYGQDYGGY